MNSSHPSSIPAIVGNVAIPIHPGRSRHSLVSIANIILILLVVFALTSLLQACTPVEGDFKPERVNMPVEVVKSSSDLIITNNTDREVFFFACPVRLLPVITWTSVVNPNTATNRVAAKSSKNFPQSQFSLETNDEVHFAWWHLGQKVNDSLNLYNADSVRGLTVVP